MFGGCDTKPCPMQVCQGIRIIMMTRMDNLGSLICPNTSVQFLDSGETEMCEEFVCSQAVTYECVQEAVAEARLEEGEDVTKIEDKMTLNSQMDPHTVEYIGGWLSKKVTCFKIQKLKLSNFFHAFRVGVKKLSLLQEVSLMG